MSPLGAEGLKTGKIVRIAGNNKLCKLITPQWLVSMCQRGITNATDVTVNRAEGWKGNRDEGNVPVYTQKTQERLIFSQISKSVLTPI